MVEIVRSGAPVVEKKAKLSKKAQAKAAAAASGAILVTVLCIQGFVCTQIFFDLCRDQTDQGLAGNNWKGSFDELPAFEGGKRIAYTVAEDAVEGYSSEIAGSADKGFTVTNTKDEKSEAPASGGGTTDTTKGKTGSSGSLPLACARRISHSRIFLLSSPMRSRSTARSSREAAFWAISPCILSAARASASGLSPSMRS